MQLGSTATPHSPKSSATCSYASGYRRHHRTQRMITTPGNWRPLNGLVGVIGMEFYSTRPCPRLRNGSGLQNARAPLALFPQYQEEANAHRNDGDQPESELDSSRVVVDPS